MQGHETPTGVPVDTSRDGAETPSREATAEQITAVIAEELNDDKSFWTKGRTMEAAYTVDDGTRVCCYWGGYDSVNVQFGLMSHHTDLWTTRDGLDALIAELQAAKVRIDAALGS